MSSSRVATPGKTRVCPHCKATILESASICPGCQHHLRFDAAIGDRRAQPAFSALRVEGELRNRENADTWEYSVVVSIRNERGEVLERRIIGVGAMTASESRTVTLSVDVFTPRNLK